MPESEQHERFAEWAILELFGHRRLAGFVSEQEIAGAGFLRLDIPAGDDGASGATQFYRPEAVYGLTAVSEELARQVAASNRPAPVQRWELPAASPTGVLADGYLANEHMLELDDSPGDDDEEEALDGD